MREADDASDLESKAELAEVDAEIGTNANANADDGNTSMLRGECENHQWLESTPFASDYLCSQGSPIAADR